MAKNDLPEWATHLIELYESGAANQFVLHGNVHDRFLLPLGVKRRLGGLDDFLEEILLAPFDVVLSYDLGNGLRVERGKETFHQWPTLKEMGSLPRKPREAIDRITHYFRYCANLGRLKSSKLQVAVIVRGAHMVMPATQPSANYELSAMASLVRDWSTESALVEHQIATFLLVPNINDLHPLVATNPRSAQIDVPLPSESELEEAINFLAPDCKKALSGYPDGFEEPAGGLIGATLSSVEGLLRTREHQKDPIEADDLAELKKGMVERDCQGLIEFVEPDRSLEQYAGQDPIKNWMRGDIKLWEKGDIEAMPMGYLLSGPVGTGKTYLVECLAGEAGVPVVKLKNFRDRWVGSTEGNLEKIFGFLHALGRCIVFIDEADQALGKRNSGSGDSGVSGRVYSMMAKEMSDTRNRGKILWILASSRPDLIEVDLKRPGRIDVKFPIFPAATPMEGYVLIRALGKKRGLSLEKKPPEDILEQIPDLVTPGAAETLSVKIYRMVQIEGYGEMDALRECLKDYQTPVPREVMEFQIQIAAREASDRSFIPEKYRVPPYLEEGA